MLGNENYDENGNMRLMDDNVNDLDNNRARQREEKNQVRDRNQYRTHHHLMDQIADLEDEEESKDAPKE